MTHHPIRCLIAALLALGVLPAQAQEGPRYPVKPVSIIIPPAPGASLDVFARLYSDKLTAAFGQPFVVDFKPGASGTIASAFVAKSAPDGHMLLMATSTTHSSNPALFKALRYDPVRDFAPVVRVGELPFVMTVNASLPARNVREFLDYARANPGKVAYAAPNSISLVASETLRAMGRIEMLGVQYKSAPQGMTDLLGGSIQMYMVDLVIGVPAIKGGKVRALGITTPTPSPLLPGVPPIAAELPGFDLRTWMGVFGPAGMPAAVVQRLATESQAALAERDVQDRLAAVGMEVKPSRSPAEFASYVAEQLAHWAMLVKQAGVEPQ